MKKSFLSLFILLGTTLTVQAQTQVATLSHEGNVSMFYGVDALKSAYEQSADGDIITLSCGAFNSVNFEKNITVRGAGMGVKVDSAAKYVEPTVLAGNFDVKSKGTTTQHFTLEGISVSNDQKVNVSGASRAQFIKCRFWTVDPPSSSNLTFTCCYIAASFYVTGTTLNATSCYIQGYNNGDSNYGHDNCVLNNCIVQYGAMPCLNNTQMKNCLLVGSPAGGSISASSSSALYCVCKGNPDAFNEIGSDEFHNSVFSGSELFEANTFYKLTAEAKAKAYQGSDGTEVGIYGGSLPFDPTPSYPQIRNFKVAPKTTTSGTLRVDMDITEP